jgi:uncharacterized protein
MTPSSPIDLGHVARDLGLPQEKIARTLELLDAGNTAPFVTRFRKDQTGGLDEEQVREIQFRIGKIRQLAERKATILKTIEAQGQLTPEIAEQIQHANTPKRLEDLYLPFKPKKQTLATIARQKGLEPLAIEIFEARPEAADLNARAATFISAEKELNTVEEVLAGVGHLVAERFSENAELRGRLRRIFQRSGRLVCTKVEPPAAAASGQESAASGQESGVGSQATGDSGEAVPRVEETSVGATEAVVTEVAAEGAEAVVDVATADVPAEPISGAVMHEEHPEAAADEASVAEAEVADETDESASEDEGEDGEHEESENDESDVSAEVTEEAAAEGTEDAAAASTPAEGTAGVDVGSALPAGRLFEAPASPVAAPLATVTLKKKKKKKKKVIGEHAFKDYYNYVEPLGRVPPHRVLAINRGERAHAIRVKIEADFEAMLREAEHFLILPGHPHGEFILNCVRDSLTRLLIPSLEREIRREITDRAEEHAVEVFIRNLRKLLLQPPTRTHRILAIDPGFKSGSKMVALDQFGNVLGHGMVFVIGKDEDRRKKARTRLADMVKQHNISVIAIGNGTGCRETEQLVADCLSEELKDRDLAYVVVNEAGASIYSTSPLGREELPQFDALQRGAISIGRRLLDPLSEMVKIHPANLGVGLYQHDIKAKHLKDSLDSVVESCVNFVGVDVNSASPALLRYVSGMNALTARRVYEHRREKGPFKNREELKSVTGFGDQTFVQAAGFLKVIGGENPLDATWIHPESYDIARRVLEKLGCDVADLAKSVPAPIKEEPKKQFAAELVEKQEESQPEGETRREGEGETTSGQESPAAILEPSADETVPSTQYSVPSTSPESPEPSPEPATAESVAPAPSAETAVTSVPETATDPESAPPVSLSPPPPLSPSPAPEAEPDQPVAEPEPSPRSIIAERAANVDVHQLAAELGVGTHLLEDILNSLTRPGIDPRDNLPPPVFRRGIMKLEDLAAGMELSGTVLNVVDFGVFVDIGLSDSGLVHISRLADRFIRDPHEVVGVGDVLKVWVVDVDKNRRRVSLTAIAPGSERPVRAPRERQPRERQSREGQQRPPQQDRPPDQQRPPRPPRQQQGGGGGRPQYGGSQQAGVGPSSDQRPPRPYGGGGGGGGGGRRDQRRGGRNESQHPTTVERLPTKPKKVKPITKAQEEGREPMRSFSDLVQLFDKKKDKPKSDEPPTAPPTT